MLLHSSHLASHPLSPVTAIARAVFWLLAGGPLITLALLALCLTAASSYGHGEDITTTPAGPHSTFHYELTRALAYGAGFDRDQADEIAVACEATDAGTFGGDLQHPITVTGTERSTVASAQYWHFARRDQDSVTGDFTWPGARSTCAYFARSNDPCQGEPELSEIEQWAMLGTGRPRTGVPRVSHDGLHFLPVAPQSMVALGLYLHAVADSYSHEQCMATAQLRTHVPVPSACEAVYWHEQAEYGPDAAQDVGVPYTKEAGRAVWIALSWYGEHVAHLPASRWSDATALAFITTWAELDHAADRRRDAVRALALR
ncbi:MAG: hypothetical protein U1E76_13540 [Planctomycetota bacterium]